MSSQQQERRPSRHSRTSYGDSPSSEAQLPRLDSRLIRGMSQTEAEEFGVRWRSSQIVRKAICGVLTKELESAIIESESGKNLDSPNALAVYADQLAYRRALRFALKLLDDPQET